MANDNRGGVSNTEVSSVLSSASRVSSCAFMAFAADAPASCARSSWRFRSTAGRPGGLQFCAVVVAHYLLCRLLNHALPSLGDAPTALPFTLQLRPQ